jgi:hypothetical protein
MPSRFVERGREGREEKRTANKIVGNKSNFLDDENEM